MEKRIKELLMHSSDMTKEEFVQKLNDVFDNQVSEIDKWYAIGREFWLRRTTATNYFCVQIFPIMESSFLCYLHVLDIEKYDHKAIEQYKKNAADVSNSLPTDIRYIYPIAISQDVDNASEMFLASNETEKNEWINKMGIR